MADTLTHDGGDDTPTSVTCTHCDYEWEYTGDLEMVTCPSCQRKTPAHPDNQ